MGEVETRALVDMLNGTHGVVNGPWVSIHHSGPGSEVRQVDENPSDKHHWPFRLAQTISGQTSNSDRANFDHIARCDPETIRAIVTELLAFRSKAQPPPHSGKE